jgi:predicted transcriptional regulator
MAQRFPVTIGLRLRNDTERALRQMARDDDRPLSAYLRRALQELVDRNREADAAPPTREI